MRENRVRRMAERQRLALQKARRRDPNAWDYGTYQLVDVDNNTIVLHNFAVGQGYGLGLDEIEAFLSERAERRPTLEEATERRSQANLLIPRGSFRQGSWKNRVLISYANFGTTIRQAVEDATLAERAEDPKFEPQYDLALLELS